MLRYDLDKISSLRIRNQKMFIEVLENKVKVHKKFNSNRTFLITSYLLPIILNLIEAFELINKGIPIIRWPLYPKDL